MQLISKEMIVIRRKNTNEYMRNNGYLRDLNDTGKSSIKLYDNINTAKSAVRCYKDNYDFIPVKVTINTLTE